MLKWRNHHVASIAPIESGEILFWNLYAEGHVTGLHKAMQLNEQPVQAATFSEAIQKLSQIHPQGHFFIKTEIGWTYRGCRIFDTESAARVALG